MNTSLRLPTLCAALAAALTLCACSSAASPAANEALIRQNLTQRLPELPAIEEVRATSMPGLFEVRLGRSDLFYTDAKGDFIIQGALFDTQTRRDLTRERVERLTALDFKALPLQDAITFKQGRGTRELAVFADPNCGYCKRFEADLQKVDDLTVHIFLLPVLGADSAAKAQHIWCAKDRAAAWQGWMLRGQTPQAASCDAAALQRNTLFAEQHQINSTPTLVFANGVRISGALSAAQLESALAQNK